jgi:hypothetical protein
VTLEQVRGFCQLVYRISSLKRKQVDMKRDDLCTRLRAWKPAFGEPVQRPWETYPLYLVCYHTSIISLFGCRLSLGSYRFIFAACMIDICVEAGRREKRIDGKEN